MEDTIFKQCKERRKIVNEVVGERGNIKRRSVYVCVFVCMSKKERAPARARVCASKRERVCLLGRER